MSNEGSSSRREFVEKITAGALAIGVGVSSFPAVASGAVSAGASMKPDQSWLNGIRGNHAQIFDMPSGNGGFPLLHVRNYIDTYKTAYGLSYPNVIPIVGLYGMTTPLAFNDAMWSKYQFGTRTNTLTRGSKTPVTRNAYAAPAAGAKTMGLEGPPIDMPASATISRLQADGTRFILCNNAFNFWIGRLAGGGAGTVPDIRAELERNMLPKVTIVPAIVIAMNQAQAGGASYMYL
ncbi:MAG: hypothetical protein Q7S20_11245 [Gemmatimonadaceae bacterium]|nr:hypothetical protein [Gemmatimonadaceae bacterium]